MLDESVLIFESVIVSCDCDASEYKSVKLKPIGGGVFLEEVLLGIIGGGWLGFSIISEFVCWWLRLFCTKIFIFKLFKFILDYKILSGIELLI